MWGKEKRDCQDGVGQNIIMKGQEPEWCNPKLSTCGKYITNMHKKWGIPSENFCHALKHILMYILSSSSRVKCNFEAEHHYGSEPFIISMHCEHLQHHAMTIYVCRCSDGIDRNRQEWVESGCTANVQCKF